MKCTNIIFSFIKISSIKTKGCAIQMLDSSLPGTHCNERIAFVRNMPDNVYSSFNHFFKIKHELLLVKIAELKTNKTMSYSFYFEWSQFLKITDKNWAIVQNIKIRSRVCKFFSSNRIQTGSNIPPFAIWN